MRTLGVAAVVVVFGLVVGACASDDKITEALAEAVTPIDPNDAIGGDISDVATAEQLDESGRRLAALLLPPAAFPVDYRVIGFAVEDPNGNGRIDGRWYPPRLVERNCSLSVDAAPVPTVGATFIPGDPSEVLTNALTASAELLTAGSSVSITIQLFDDATQRDLQAEILQEFAGRLDSLECDFDGAFDGALGERFDEAFDDSLDPSDLLFGESRFIEPYPTAYPGFAVVTAGLFGSGEGHTYAVGDRVLLSIGISDRSLFADDGAPSAMSLLEFRQVIDLQLARLVDRGLG